ncbi:MAG: hypothetical protein JW797_11870 [Bradymonadales bacterium]|nr:hypothetical protein [Bradymonadales bacterium]
MGGQQPLSPVEIPIELVEGTPLEQAFEQVLLQYQTAGYDPLDAQRAYATSAAGEFTWYFTIMDSEDPGGRVNHVYFVVVEPWDAEQTRRFLLSYLVLAAAPPSGGGRHLFHFHSAFPVPFAVRFLFSGTPPAGLEASILTDLGTRSWEPGQVEGIAGHLRMLLARYQLARPEQLDSVCPAVLDEIYLSLPHPGSQEQEGVFGESYLPEGVLAAIGLLVGESIRATAADRIAWEPDEVSTIYPRLRVSGMREGILRPCSMMIELFAAGAEVMPSRYCGQMIERVAELTGQSIDSGDR